jgi:sigma-B regulation protein RsbU (phosphoserine phosphatase)
MITRMVVADVSGHGASVAEFSLSLRAILRKNINQKSQTRVVERLNQQFAEMAELRRFATALVVTYLTSTDRLSICNAGHPRPLFYRAIDRKWSLLSPALDDSDDGGNLPLGLDQTTRYHTFDVTLGADDLAIFYTDALIEAADASGRLLGESGLLAAARELELANSRPDAIGMAVLSAVRQYRALPNADDDVTMIVLRHNGSASPRLSLAEKVDVYAKVFHLKPV